MFVFACFFLLPHFILVNKDFQFNSQGPAGEKGDRGDGELPFYDDKYPERARNITYYVHRITKTPRSVAA